jgi:predicted dehydrogenase
LSPILLRVKKSWVIKALVAGKHVVLEKPTALTADDYEEMLAAAYANRKFILDGTMFPHQKRTNDVLVAITEESKVGKVDQIECNFSFMGGEGFDDANIRASKEGNPHGCIGGLGWYCIRYALMVFGKLGSVYKTSRVVDFKLNKHGVPVDATCVVQFDDVSWLTRRDKCSTMMILQSLIYFLVMS